MHVVVIGAGLGGLSSAAYLSRSGHNVTLLERDDIPGGRAGVIDSHGFRLDNGPTLLTMPGLLEDAFVAAGANMADFVTIKKVDPMYRAVYEDGSELMVRHGRAMSNQKDGLVLQVSDVRAEACGVLLLELRDPQGAPLPAFEPGAHLEIRLPGGLVRLAPRGQLMASMQRGGSSADCWVMTDGEVDTTSLLQSQPSTLALAHHKSPVTSRAAENLFWLGRYTERAENAVRLAQIVLNHLGGEEPNSKPLMAWLSATAQENSLVLPGVPAAEQASRVFARSLMAGLSPAPGTAIYGQSYSVGFNLRALKSAASQVRERLSPENWNLIERVEAEFARDCAAMAADAEYGTAEALAALQGASELLSAITGAQTDRMVRDSGWRLLSIGRHIERIATLSRALRLSLETGCLHDPAGFEAVIALFDSTITFHAMYQQRRDMVALVDLLVMDRDNPRSLAWVVQTLRSRLAKLAQAATIQDAVLAQALPDPDTWVLAELSNWQRSAEGERHWCDLEVLLDDCEAAVSQLSEEITRLHFSHADRANQSL